MNLTLSPITSPGRFFAPGLCAVAIALAPLVAAPQYDYSQLNDKNYVNNTGILERTLGTSSSNNQSLKITAPRAQVSATFTPAAIAVDGVREAAWDAATAYPITNAFTTAMTGLAPTATAQGTLRLLWDGPVLYGLVEVTGDSTKSDTATPTWNVASYTPTSDGLFVFMDVFNDKWGMECDTQGVFFGPANPAAAPTSFNNSGIPSLGSFFNAANQDYSTRLKAFKSSGYVAGTGVNYTYEFALQIEGWGDQFDRPLTNDTKIGLEVGIFNQSASFTYLSKTLFYADQEGGSNLPNSERVRNRDWAEVTLAGWDGVTPFAYSGWRADEDIRFWNSKSNPGGTGAANSGDNSLAWTPGSKNLMLGAKNAYLALKADPSATRADLETAVQAVCQAFAGLTWADTRYPDPHDMPALQTLPNAWKFFDPAKGTNGMVTNLSEWQQRKQEILDLAQFYEYGYKPKLGVDYTISVGTNAYNGTGTTATVIAQVIPTNVNFKSGVPANVTVTVTLPTAGLPAGQKAVIGFSTSMTANGIANVGLPTGWGADIRTDAGAWGTPNATVNGNTNRTGTFYGFFPYSRNNNIAADVSYEMATATGVSIFLDILQAACAANPALDAKLDPTRAVTKGFSINAKLAFIAAVYDDRVKAVIVGGAGATGPANWRYNCQGQEYNFHGTAFVTANNPGADAIVSHGTEGPGNSYRHNRVRETELFRHFMPYGHMYNHEEGSYAYGEYSRMPFDNALLVACLAPDRAILDDSNLNDYNDGSCTDNMALQVAKLVYNGLGANADNFVKFNIGNYVSSGDPHGSPGGALEGHYMADLFYGATPGWVPTLTAAEATRLNTDPYSLLVCNGQTQTPYDWYWGGFNTITGGTGGITGTDGWCYYSLPPAVTAGQAFSVVEGAANGTVVGNVTATDPNPGTTFQGWAITGGTGSAYFAIDATTGQITVTNGAALDYEAATSYTLNVRVSDGYSNSTTTPVTVNLLNANDTPPVVGAGQSFVLGAGAVNTVGTPAASDADGATTFQNWQITGGTGAGVFAINPTTGTITISNPNGINFNLTSYTLAVQVGDGTNVSAPQTVTITIPTTVRVTVNGRVVLSYKLSVPSLLRAGGAIGG